MVCVHTDGEMKRQGGNVPESKRKREKEEKREQERERKKEVRKEKAREVSRKLWEES